MDFTNTLANNEEDLQDEDFCYDEEDSIEECELLNITFTKEMRFYQLKKFHHWKSFTKKV